MSGRPTGQTSDQRSTAIRTVVPSSSAPIANESESCRAIHRPMPADALGLGGTRPASGSAMPPPWSVTSQTTPFRHDPERELPTTAGVTDRVSGELAHRQDELLHPRTSAARLRCRGPERIRLTSPSPLSIRSSSEGGPVTAAAGLDDLTEQAGGNLVAVARVSRRVPHRGVRSPRLLDHGGRERTRVVGTHDPGRGLFEDRVEGRLVARPRAADPPWRRSGPRRRSWCTSMSAVGGIGEHPLPCRDRLHRMDVEVVGGEEGHGLPRRSRARLGTDRCATTWSRRPRRPRARVPSATTARGCSSTTRRIRRSARRAPTRDRQPGDLFRRLRRPTSLRFGSERDATRAAPQVVTPGL